MLRLFGAPGAARARRLRGGRAARRRATRTASRSGSCSRCSSTRCCSAAATARSAERRRAALRGLGLRRMDLGIAGRTAVVTGASRGIGAATARRCSRREGARVVGVSRGDGHRRHRARRRRADRRAGRRRRSTSSSTTPARASPRALDELTDDDWNGQWELHVMASMRLMRAFAPGDGRARLGPDRQRRLVGRQAPVADQRRLLGHQGRAALALARVRRHLRGRRACSSTRSRPAPVASGAVDGRGRPRRPDGRRARASSREEAIDGAGGQGPARPLRRPRRRSRRVVAFLCSERASMVDRRRLVGRRRHRRHDQVAHGQVRFAFTSVNLRSSWSRCRPRRAR